MAKTPQGLSPARGRAEVSTAHWLPDSGSRRQGTWEHSRTSWGSCLCIGMYYSGHPWVKELLQTSGLCPTSFRAITSISESCITLFFVGVIFRNRTASVNKCPLSLPASGPACLSADTGLCKLLSYTLAARPAYLLGEMSLTTLEANQQLARAQSTHLGRAVLELGPGAWKSSFGCSRPFSSCVYAHVHTRATDSQVRLASFPYFLIICLFLSQQHVYIILKAKALCKAWSVKQWFPGSP